MKIVINSTTELAMLSSHLFRKNSKTIRKTSFPTKSRDSQKPERVGFRTLGLLGN